MEKEGETMMLNLGCGKDYREGWINADNNPDGKKDVNLDIEDTPYDFESNSFDLILVKLVLEHIHQEKFMDVMNELHRIVKPEGKIIIVLPTDNKSGDPTHLNTNLNANTFKYLKNFEIAELTYHCDKLGNCPRFLQFLFPFSMLHYTFTITLKKKEAKKA